LTHFTSWLSRFFSAIHPFFGNIGNIRAGACPNGPGVGGTSDTVRVLSQLRGSFPRFSARSAFCTECFGSVFPCSLRFSHLKFLRVSVRDAPVPAARHVPRRGDLLKPDAREHAMRDSAGYRIRAGRARLSFLPIPCSLPLAFSSGVCAFNNVPDRQKILRLAIFAKRDCCENLIQFPM
jgi:hypothetical protein